MNVQSPAKSALPVRLPSRHARGGISLSNQEWREISWFESYDLTKSWYQQTHQRQMNATKTRQVNAFFIQGREYFKRPSCRSLSGNW